MVADYGQLELRLLAHMTSCQSMLTAFKLGGDFHSRTALGMYDHIKEAIDQGALPLCPCLCIPQGAHLEVHVRLAPPGEGGGDLYMYVRMTLKEEVADKARRARKVLIASNISLP